MTTQISKKQKPGIQPKLHINAIGDQYELEADTMADRVMQTSNAAGKQATHMIAPSLQRKCAACEKDEEKNKSIMRKAQPGNSMAQASPGLVSSLAAVQGGGSALHDSTRNFMEHAFSTDFSHVRVHTGQQASAMSNDIHAKAFTYGSDIFFNQGEYAPETDSGKKLLAHELTHVVQQTGNKNSGHVTSNNQPRLNRQPLPGFQPKYSRRIAQAIGSELLDGFALESYALTETHKGRLGILAITLTDLLHDYPDGGIDITGHTDATGINIYNDWLGQKRADVVRDHLIEAGIPPASIMTDSAGEDELQVKTEKPDADNRRVMIRFRTTSTGSEDAPTGLKPPDETVKQEQVKIDLTVPPRFATVEPAKACDSKADCNASTKSFDKQPAALQRIINRSFPDYGEYWFWSLDSGLKTTLINVYRQLCKYGLIYHISSIKGIVEGETTSILWDKKFGIPGDSTSVLFVSYSGTGLLTALLDSGHFCKPGPLGGSAHSGQHTFREFGLPDSMHISIGPGNDFDVHLDAYSPVPDPSGMNCPDDATSAALIHIGRELIPGMVTAGLRELDELDLPLLDMSAHVLRKLLSGLQFQPDFTLSPSVPQPEPESGWDVPPYIAAGLTWRWPLKEETRKLPTTPWLPKPVETSIREGLPEYFQQDALVPPGASSKVTQALYLKYSALPEEETALTAKADEAKIRFASFADDAYYFAEDLAREMNLAASQGETALMMKQRLNGVYAHLDRAESNYITEEIIKIGRVVRKLLGGKALAVYKVSVPVSNEMIWVFDLNSGKFETYWLE